MFETKIVTTQAEYDAIPDDFRGCVYIQSPSRIIVAKSKSSVEACGNDSVEARGNARVEAWGNASVEAYGSASVVAYGSASVVAYGNASVEAYGSASVVAYGNASVEALGNASVEAYEDASVEALGNASVEAWGNASVEARGNASVEALGNASVEARGNVQVAKYSDSTKIITHGNARIVTPPKTIEEFCDYYGVMVKDGAAILYKVVREDLTAFHDGRYQYAVGTTLQHECDPDTNKDCGYGLHVSHLHGALDFGRGRKFKILECAVPLDKIVLPKYSGGKVRTSELTVLREVQLEECGVYGKILAKERATQTK